MDKIGKYQVLGLLGQGAMGIVYKALDPDINRKVAIKVIRFDRISEDTEKTEIIRRFIREAQAAGKLVHPNIITVYDVGRVKDLTYIVMQLIEGQSLKKALAGGKIWTPAQVVPLMIQLCEALDYAHAQGIVHRDIKPANILLDMTGRPYILDFGVARVEMSTLTQSGSIVGTPSYMAPEQVMGKKIDTRADIFSLGVMLYEMLTGKRPFEGDHITTVVYKIIHEDPPDLLECRQGLPPGFGAIVNKALAKDPECRYRNCRELREDLARVPVDADATLSLPGVPSDTSRIVEGTKKRSRRRRVALLGGAASALLVSLGMIVFVIPGFRDRGTAEPKNEAGIQNRLPDATEKPSADPAVTELKTLDELFDEKKYAEVLRTAQEALRRFPGDERFKAYVSRSEAMQRQESIDGLLAAGKREYNQGRYAKCIELMQETLNIDPGNTEAQKNLTQCVNAVARGEITLMIERQRSAEEGKDLLGLLNDYGVASLIDIRKNELTDLFNRHDEIKSFISNISVKFLSSKRAEVAYQNLVSAVLKRTGQRKIIFEGNTSWIVEKQNGGWKIVEYNRRNL